MQPGRSRRRVTITLASLSVLVAFSPVTAAASNCQGTSVGLVPIDDLRTGTYQAFEGGLYPGGINRVPAAHQTAGMSAVAGIVPRDAAGNPDPQNGKIVIATIGMSNMRTESTWLEFLVSFDPRKNPAVVVANGARGGEAAADMIRPNGTVILAGILNKLATLQLTPAQVQVIWYKQANKSPTQGFPAHAQILESQNQTIIQALAARFPNARICYVASRIYGGYASTNLNPEPIAYETGFAYKWLVGRQIAGDPELNFDPAAGPVKAPWLAWGPYLWADGLHARSDGMYWACSDFLNDGTHPDFIGALRVATKMVRFLATDPTAAPWYLGSPGSATAVAELPAQETWSVLTPRPNPFVTELSIPLRLTKPGSVTATVYSLDGRQVRLLGDRPFGAGQHSLRWDGRDDAGRRVVSGTYLVRIGHGEDARTVKATLVR